jgi:hypothetical protein
MPDKGQGTKGVGTRGEGEGEGEGVRAEGQSVFGNAAPEFG